MRPHIITALLVMAPVLAACSAGPRDALQAAVAHLDQRVPSVVQAIRLDTSTNHQTMGREGGLIAASVVYDRRARCLPDDHASCGAVLEEWPSARGARQRAADLRAQGHDVVVDDRLVLQLSPQLGTAARQQYRAALQSG